MSARGFSRDCAARNLTNNRTLDERRPSVPTGRDATITTVEVYRPVQVARRLRTDDGLVCSVRWSLPAS